MTKFISITTLLVFSTVQAGNIFQQNFDDGGVPADYVSGGTAGGSLFTDIGNNAEGSVAVTSNQLVIGNPQLAGPSAVNYDAGWGITGLTIDSGDIMRFEVDIRFATTTGAGDFAPSGGIVFGDYSGNYDTYPHNASRFTSIGFRRNGGTQMRIEPDNGSPFEVTYGEMNTFNIFLNDSGVAQSYIGPDGGTYNLSVSTQFNDGLDPDSYVQGSYAVWLGNSLLGDDLVAPTYFHSGAHNTSSVLDTVYMYSNSAEAVGLETTYDNFSISSVASIPEPSSIFLVVTALGGLMIFRRQRG